MTTSTDDVPGATLAGVNEHVVSAGRPEQEKFSVEDVERFGVNVICDVADCPAVTVAEGTVKAGVRSFTAVTVVLSEATSLPVLPSPPPETVTVLTNEP